VDALATAPSLLDGVSTESTLAETLDRVWEALSARRPGTCPVCAGEMQPEYGAQARPIGGRCRSCETTLT